MNRTDATRSSQIITCTVASRTTSDGATNYTYDGLNRLVTAGTSALAYSGTSIDVTTTGAEQYSYTPGGSLLGAATGGTSGMAWNDQHTDLIGLLDPNTGTPTGSRTYSPHGELVSSSGTQPALGFQHQYTDPDSGNVNMGARWYQPGTGTFASRDTTGLDPRDLNNANRHAYAAGSPLVHRDPSGRFLPAAALALRIAASPAGRAALAGAGRFTLRAGAAALRGMGLMSSGTFTMSRSPNLFSWTRPNTSQGGGGRFGRGGGRRVSLHSGPGIAPVGPGTSATGATRGHAGAVSAAERARQAYLAWLAARRQRVIVDALTPHHNPRLLDPVIADSIQAQIDAANNQAPIELGILNPTVGADEQPYQPDGSSGHNGPAPLPPANGVLEGACATGGHTNSDGSRTGQVWGCGPGSDPLYAASDKNVDITKITPDPVWRTDRELLYRLDHRTLDGIFEAGFTPWDTNGQLDLSEYVRVNQPSPFVSTTYDQNLYMKWKKQRYVDVIDAPGGIMVNRTIGSHKFEDQEEVAFPGGIDSSFIVGVHEVSPDRKKLGPLIKNPNSTPR